MVLIDRLCSLLSATCKRSSLQVPAPSPTGIKVCGFEPEQIYSVTVLLSLAIRKDVMCACRYLFVRFNWDLLVSLPLSYLEGAHTSDPGTFNPTELNVTNWVERQVTERLE